MYSRGIHSDRLKHRLVIGWWLTVTNAVAYYGTVIFTAPKGEIFGVVCSVYFEFWSPVSNKKIVKLLKVTNLTKICQKRGDRSFIFTLSFKSHWVKFPVTWTFNRFLHLQFRFLNHLISKIWTLNLAFLKLHLQWNLNAFQQLSSKLRMW